MFKKIVLFALVMIPVMAFAQESQKIAHVNYGEVVMAMPEYAQMMDSMKKQEAEFVAEFQNFQDEYNKKYSDFLEQQETLNESIKIRRMQDIQDVAQKAEQFQQYAQQQQAELEQALLTPIFEKLQKAIDDVGRENNFLYILETTTLRFVSPNASDATPLVKRKLGI